MRETDLPGQVTALLDFMGENTFACTFYEGQLSDEQSVKSGVRQGDISSGILFIIKLNEVASDTSYLHVRCTLNCRKVIIIGYAVDYALVAPATQA